MPAAVRARPGLIAVLGVCDLLCSIESFLPLPPSASRAHHSLFYSVVTYYCYLYVCIKIINAEVGTSRRVRLDTIVSVVEYNTHNIQDAVFPRRFTRSDLNLKFEFCFLS